jgi:transcriptional regulator of acetoin/glycerol metabolism
LQPASPNLDREPDIVLAILDIVMRTVPTLSADQARDIELQVRDQYGGLRTRIAKRKKHPTPEQRAQVFQDALTDADTDDITAEHGISRRTLYRYLKRGGL